MFALALPPPSVLFLPHSYCLLHPFQEANNIWGAMSMTKPLHDMGVRYFKSHEIVGRYTLDVLCTIPLI